MIPLLIVIILTTLALGFGIANPTFATIIIGVSFVVMIILFLALKRWGLLILLTIGVWYALRVSPRWTHLFVDKHRKQQAQEEPVQAQQASKQETKQGKPPSANGEGKTQALSQADQKLYIHAALTFLGESGGERTAAGRPPTRCSARSSGARSCVRAASRRPGPR